MYLVAVLDWHFLYVARRELDQTLELPFVLTIVNRLLRECIFSNCYGFFLDHNERRKNNKIGKERWNCLSSYLDERV